jgi:DNA-binding transcriptional MerR regulator
MTDSPSSQPGLLIGDAARLSGLTSRAIRHYHAIGLLPEPARDASGYRRYGTADLITLVRIGRLRALGMPTWRIPEQIERPADSSLGHDLAALAAVAG